MLPRSIPCEECGKTAIVRGYGRVVYDWNADGSNVGGENIGGNDTTALTIRSVRLTIDCPDCGLRVQEHRPEISKPEATNQRPQSTQTEKRRQATHAFATLLARSMTQPGLREIHR